MSPAGAAGSQPQPWAGGRGQEGRSWEEGPVASTKPISHRKWAFSRNEVVRLSTLLPLTVCVRAHTHLHTIEFYSQRHLSHMPHELLGDRIWGEGEF